MFLIMSIPDCTSTLPDKAPNSGTECFKYLQIISAIALAASPTTGIPLSIPDIKFPIRCVPHSNASDTGSPISSIATLTLSAKTFIANPASTRAADKATAPTEVASNPAPKTTPANPVAAIPAAITSKDLPNLVTAADIDTISFALFAKSAKPDKNCKNFGKKLAIAISAISKASAINLTPSPIILR